ncbi:MAG TPA: ATP-binding protein [Microbacteriaceae bacterium]|nr:ATP-binding protein [Microbacteriaceae bacterium]
MSAPRVRLPFSLRARLLVGTIVLLAVLSAIVGASSVAIVHRSLLDQVDAQLLSVVTRGQGGFDADRDHDPGAGGSGDFSSALRVPGQAVGTVVAGKRGNLMAGTVIREGGQIDALSLEQLRALASVSQFTSLDIPELGSYRAVAASTPNGRVMVFAIPLQAAERTTALLAWSIALVVCGVLAIAAFAGSWMIRRSLRPLAEVTRTATEVSGMDLSRGEVALHARVPDEDERTEVGQLGAAFNRMLGHVARSLDAREQSEQKVRQFVADASHELRTPLAAIRGYAELTRMSPEQLPADAAHALGRIEAESVRMTELVEDLLLLARLDEGRELELRETDLARVLSEVVDDARVAGPSHPIELKLAQSPCVVAVDEARIRQVVVNLLSNTRVHTPDGTSVQVSLSGDEHGVVFTVSDSGPGIDPAVRATLFERFARADSSRSRAAGSTGLGLAIAWAVVHAHGGDIRVESEPGRTTFSVSLPRDGSVS